MAQPDQYEVGATAQLLPNKVRWFAAKAPIPEPFLFLGLSPVAREATQCGLSNLIPQLLHCRAKNVW
jgi:hypothetical protein